MRYIQFPVLSSSGIEKTPADPSALMMEGRVHKHTVYENLLQVLQTIFPSFDRRQYSGYLL
jgi:hypothetical protein